jgi:hypothetical protein
LWALYVPKYSILLPSADSALGKANSELKKQSVGMMGEN